ncbi:MAG: enolase [Gemmatimonadetes bacterium]|nr:enolase [Gemmatimonadota bacterium]|tara:strand:+ start:4491 stop:5648 length:1158 start_codon:yes stop_codon:yes gene_type:complete
MKVTDLQVIPFSIPRKAFRNGKCLEATTVTQTLTKILTDQGAEGYYFGGHGHGDQDGMTADQINVLTGRLKQMLVGHDPFDREKFWHWMWVANIPENLLSVVDMTLWDLQARAFGVPVHKLLGGCRERVRAYGSTFPNMGSPEDYAAHALACKAEGYTHYKIHPYYFWDPETGQSDPGRPSHIEWDIRCCQAVRDAVGDHMVLSFDPWGTYRTYEDAFIVGRELERLGFYWYEHPMNEYRVGPYEKLARELTIPILSPEIAAGSIYTRFDWIARGASDMTRIDILRGGITGCIKMAAIAEAAGVKCEMHMAGFANLQILGATSEDVCTYYERGLLAPGVDYDTPQPYLEEICDPMDKAGYVTVPTEPGMGYKINWDYIEAHRIDR